MRLIDLAERDKHGIYWLPKNLTIKDEVLEGPAVVVIARDGFTFTHNETWGDFDAVWFPLTRWQMRRRIKAPIGALVSGGNLTIHGCELRGISFMVPPNLKRLAIRGTTLR